MICESQEKVMVVSSELLFKYGKWQGLWLDYKPELLEIIQNSYTFLPRSEVEHDSSWQQIIPYQVFTHAGKFYVAQKLKGSTEQRLHFKYMLGMGGHINLEDDVSGEILEKGIQREWNEEISYKGSFKRNLVGILKDHNNDVSKVHIALVYLLEGEHDRISTLEPNKMSGKMYSLDEIKDIYEDLDSWGQILYPYLSGGKNLFEWI